jgi:hypothetical protein
VSLRVALIASFITAAGFAVSIVLYNAAEWIGPFVLMACVWALVALMVKEWLK